MATLPVQLVPVVDAVVSTVDDDELHYRAFVLKGNGSGFEYGQIVGLLRLPHCTRLSELRFA